MTAKHTAAPQMSDSYVAPAEFFFAAIVLLLAESKELLLQYAVLQHFK